MYNLFGYNMLICTHEISFYSIKFYSTPGIKQGRGASFAEQKVGEKKSLVRHLAEVKRT